MRIQKSPILAALAATLCVAVIATPRRAEAAAPEIVLRTRGGQYEVAWPSRHLGYRVERSTSPTGIPEWHPVEAAATRIDGEYRLSVRGDSEVGLFRLVQAEDLSIDAPGDFADTNGDGIDGDFSRGVFLAPPPFGNDGNPGTELLPVATLELAVELAESIPLKHDVYIAAGDYYLDRPLLMPAFVSLIGQYDGTTDWGRSAENVTTIHGPSTALVLGAYPANEITTNRVCLIGLNIVAANAILPGDSSYGVFILDRDAGVYIQDCTITAGNGANGESGEHGDAGKSGAAGSVGGDAASGGAAGLGGFALEGTLGGDGGFGGLGSTGGSGSNAPPTSDGILGGLGGSGGSSRKGCKRGDGGEDGKDGHVGAAGFHGAAPVVFWGGLRTNGYTAINGADGQIGIAGTGGGGAGGGGSNASGTSIGCPPEQAGGGGGGGGGGLPGGFGRGGGGGGSSVAVFALHSIVEIRDCILKSNAAGVGGNGGDGGAGGMGGPGGAGGSGKGFGASGGTGAEGGNGGPGGAGVGGAGGHSICLLFDGSTTDLKVTAYGTVYQLGTSGIGGMGGSNGTLVRAPSGRTGLILGVARR